MPNARDLLVLRDILIVGFRPVPPQLEVSAPARRCDASGAGDVSPWRLPKWLFAGNAGIKGDEMTRIRFVATVWVVLAVAWQPVGAQQTDTDSWFTPPATPTWYAFREAPLHRTGIWLGMFPPNAVGYRGQQEEATTVAESLVGIVEQQPATSRNIGHTTVRPSTSITTTDFSFLEDEPSSVAVEATKTEAVGNEDFISDQETDIGRTIEKSSKSQTLRLQQRSLRSFSPYIRGYQDQAVYLSGDGLFLASIRPDLDSMLSRIDPSLVDSVSIISGPYGLRYGPGFSFLTVTTIPTPRYYNGYESHFRTGLTTRLNGGRVFGRETALGGGADWGYIIGYTAATASAYAPGNASLQTNVPGSFRSQGFVGQFGFDLTENSVVEFRYRRLDDTDVAYPLQFFDVDAQSGDALSLHYKHEDPYGYTTTRVMGWYTRSRMSGDTVPQQPAPYDVMDRVNEAINELNLTNGADLFAATRGDVTTTGGRVSRTWGPDGEFQWTVGGDARYVSQRIQEDFADRGGVLGAPFTTKLPRSSFTDAGIYTELVMPWSSYFQSTAGARIDFFSSSARLSDVDPLFQERDQIRQNDILYTFYVTNRVEVSRNWLIRASVGYAQTPPTLLQRYADGVFVTMAQSGLTRVIGSPTLRKESGWQVDLMTQARYERFRGAATAFYSWVDSPIIVQGFPVVDLTGAYLVRFTNGELFTRTGFELRGDVILTERLSIFGTAAYLYGRDRNILLQSGARVDQPLVGIYPFNSVVGVNLVDPDGGERWGLTFAVRMVAHQRLTGGLRTGTGAPDTIDTDFERPTGGFTTAAIRGYYNFASNLSIVGGIENLFDRTYVEHLNARLPHDTINGRTFQAVAVQAPGITPYVGLEWFY